MAQDKNSRPSGDAQEFLQPLLDDDAFLTELSQGNDPSHGEDPLAGALLELRDDVEKQMPPAPRIEGADNVIALPTGRRRRRPRPIMHGLIGAAAATLLIAGSGAVIMDAKPGSPLYGLNQQMFGNDKANVELASTLDEMESRAAEGDMDGTRALLAEARRIMDGSRSSDKPTRTPEPTSERPEPAPVPETETATVTDTPAPETETTTVHVTERETATVTETTREPLIPLPDWGEDEEPTESPTAEPSPEPQN